MRALSIVMLVVGYLGIAIIIFIISQFSPLFYSNCAHDCGWSGDWFLGVLGVGGVIAIVPIGLVLWGHHLHKLSKQQNVGGQYEERK